MQKETEYLNIFTCSVVASDELFIWVDPGPYPALPREIDSD